MNINNPLLETKEYLNNKFKVPIKLNLITKNKKKYVTIFKEQELYGISYVGMIDVKKKLFIYDNNKHKIKDKSVLSELKTI